MTKEKRTLIIDDYVEPAADIGRELLRKWATQTLRALGIPGEYLKPTGKVNAATAKASMEWFGGPGSEREGGTNWVKWVTSLRTRRQK